METSVERATITTWLLLCVCLVAAPGCQSSRQQVSYWDVLDQQSASVLMTMASQHPEPRVRARAIQALASSQLSLRARWIRHGLYDPDPAVRVSSCVGLMRLSDERAAPTIQRLLQDPSAAVRAAATLYELRRGHKSGLTSFQTLITDCNAMADDWSFRLLALEASDLLSRPIVREMVSRCTEQSSADVLTLLLLKMGDPTATRRAIAHATGADSRLAAQAIEFLAVASDPRVMFLLIERIEDSPELQTRLQAALSASRFGRREGLKLAVRHLRHDPTHVQGQADSAKIRELACLVCAELGNYKLLETLRMCLETEQEDFAKIACAEAIQRILAREAR